MVVHIIQHCWIRSLCGDEIVKKLRNSLGFPLEKKWVLRHFHLWFTVIGSYEKYLQSGCKSESWILGVLAKYMVLLEVHYCPDITPHTIPRSLKQWKVVYKGLRHHTSDTLIQISYNSIGCPSEEGSRLSLLTRAIRLVETQSYSWHLARVWWW